MNPSKNAGLQNVLEINTPDSCKTPHDWEYDYNDYMSETHCIKQCKTCSKIVVSDKPHQFGEWRYIDDKNCYQERECVICDKIESSKKQQHIYGDWEYLSDDSCKQVKRCQRCGMILNRKVEHDYGDWEYEKNNCCKLIIKCKRCGEIKDYKIAEHIFGDWEFEAYGLEKCIKVKECLRCDLKKYGEKFDHDWVDLPNASYKCERVLECKRCKKEKIENVHHSGIWEYIDSTNCDQVKKCSICNEIIETRINPERFINYIKSRNIKYLMHFTVVKNLSSIFSNGLLDREALEFYKIEHALTDDNRFDEKLDFISISVSFPNYKMFFRKREELKRNGLERDWAILRLKPSILWEKNCLFFSENAATTNSKSINYKNNRLEDFQKMFSDIPSLNIYRLETKIADYYTTNPQAEVMVHSNIEPKYIHSICFDLKDNIYDWDRVVKLRKKYKNIDFFFTPRLFRQRDDWMFWQKNVDNHIRPIRDGIF